MLQIFEVIEVGEYPFYITVEVEEGEQVRDVINSTNSRKVYLLVDHNTKRIWMYSGKNSSYKLQVYGGILAGMLRKQLGFFYRIFNLNKYSLDDPKFQNLLDNPIEPGKAEIIDKKNFLKFKIKQKIVNRIIRNLQLNKASKSLGVKFSAQSQDINKLPDAFQIPEGETREERPRLSDEDIMILDLESEEGIKLIKQYEKEIGEQGTQRGKETIKFTKWLKGEEVETRNVRLLREKDESIRENFLRKMRKRRGRGDDRYPYPYVFKPPEPPDDIALAPQSQVFAPSKDKDSDDKEYCQYCGKLLTQDEQITHSCKKKPE